MNTLAGIAALTAINPLLGLFAAAGLIGFAAGCADGKKDKPKPSTLKLTPPSTFEETIKTVRAVNQHVQSTQKKEKQQQSVIQTLTHEAQQHTLEIKTCHQRLKKTTSNIQSQTVMGREQLEALDALNHELTSIKNTLTQTKNKLLTREQEMAELVKKLSEANIKLSESVKTNTTNSTEVITQALRIQKAHQNTVDPMLQAKDAQIQKLKEEVSSLRKTLRIINQRLAEAMSQESAPSPIPPISQHTVLSSKSAIKAANETAPRRVMGVA